MTGSNHNLYEESGYLDGAGAAWCDLLTGVCYTRSQIHSRARFRARELLHLAGRAAAAYAACYLWGYCHIKESRDNATRGRKP